MARIRLRDEQQDPALSPLISKIRGQRRGRLINLYKALLNSPPLTEGWLHLFTAIRQQGTLSADWRELAVMAVAALNRCSYVLREHRNEALACGLTETQLGSLADWRNCLEFDEKQRAVLAYAEAMTRTVQVPDAVFRAVKESFSEREIVELTAVIGGYNLVSRFLEALEVESDA